KRPRSKDFTADPENSGRARVWLMASRRDSGVSDHSSLDSHSCSKAVEKKVRSFRIGPLMEVPGWYRRKRGLVWVRASGLRALKSSFCVKKVPSPCHLLVPERVTILTSPPAAPPDSAPTTVPETRNSCTISTPTA